MVPASPPLSDRRFEALVVAFGALADAAAVDGWDRLGNRIVGLCDHGVDVMVVRSGDDPTIHEADAAIGAGRGGRDRLRLCDGGDHPSRLRPAIVEALGRAGVTGGLVLRVGDPFDDGPDPSDPDRWVVAPVLDCRDGARCRNDRSPIPLLDLLDDQLTRRLHHRVPSIDDDPAWVVELPSASASMRVAESIGTCANGAIGVRGAREEDGPGSSPLVIAAGVYTAAALRHGPIWTAMDVHDVGPDRRLLDLRTGILHRSSVGTEHLASVRFVSAARSEALAMRVEGGIDHIGTDHPLAAPGSDNAMRRTRRGGVVTARTLDADGGGIAVAAVDDVHDADGRRVVERIATWTSVAPGGRRVKNLGRTVDELTATGFDGLLAEHRATWAERWSGAHVSIDGAPEDELATRFAVFHLLSCAAGGDEVAVGARGLTGPAYGGHVFWDADVFVLPVLAALAPHAARAMLAYRHHRLSAARAAARRLGRRGARFPWESADAGTDVTPYDVGGVPILTGDREEHIVGAVAWAADQYAGWTGDRHFVDGSGRGLVVDTAEYWAGRVRVGDDGRAHIDQVMGPDEYHPTVDDDVYTNVLARWHLEAAAAVVEADDPRRADRFRHAAAALVDGWDGTRGVHEQFSGYFGLESLTMEDVGVPPVAADVVLGAERTARSQIIKQPDVLMAHHLVPDAMRPGSLGADLAFYGPRTAHGSSLSPAIHAAIEARAGHPDRALQMFRIAARLDLDDITGTTAAGLHVANMGGLWQAVVGGFLGVRPHPGYLAIDPCLPEAWDGVVVHCGFRGAGLRLHATHEVVTVGTTRPVRLRISAGDVITCDPPGCTIQTGGAR